MSKSCQYSHSSLNSVQKCIRVLVGDNLFFTLENHFYRRNATLPISSWKVLRRTTFLSCTSYKLWGQDSICYTHCSEPPLSFSLYSIGEKQVFPRTPALWNQDVTSPITTICRGLTVNFTHLHNLYLLILNIIPIVIFCLHESSSFIIIYVSYILILGDLLPCLC